jgi:hypothetical protein
VSEPDGELPDDVPVSEPDGELPDDVPVSEPDGGLLLELLDGLLFDELPELGLSLVVLGGLLEGLGWFGDAFGNSLELLEDGFPDTLPAGVCCVLDGALGVALFPVVAVGCCVVGCVVTVGVAGLDKSTFTGV